MQDENALKLYTATRGDREKIRALADYRNAQRVTILMAVQLGAFIAFDTDTEYFTYYDNSKMMKTKNISTVMLYLVTLLGDVEEA